MKTRLSIGTFILSAAFLLGQAPPPAAVTAQVPAPGASSTARDLFVTVGKSLVVESPVNVHRLSIANPALAEAVAISPREMLINGKGAGETSLIVWQDGGNRLLFDLHVRQSSTKLDAVRQELDKEFAGQRVEVTLEEGSVFLRGTVNDVLSAERAVAIASVLGKPVNLLRVKVPPVEDQILLKVRFANVDRSAATELATNFLLTDKSVSPSSLTTSPFSATSPATAGRKTGFALTDAMNLLLFRRDPAFGALLHALQNKRLLEILAEPNVLAINGKAASFLAGGEVPIPTVQSGAVGGGAAAVTIQYREFGVRINFLPTITPRGTIRLQVAPEVSSLDYANAVVLNAFTIPALSTRRVQTEIELEDGQSFAIAGLLDNRAVESMSKIPGLGSIPLLGKLFQSRSLSRNNTELLVLVTPELVRPIPAGQPLPDVKMPMPFLSGTAAKPPQTPGKDVTGPVPVKPVRDTVPVEQLQQEQKGAPPATSAGTTPAAQGAPYTPPPPPTAPATQRPEAPKP